MNSRTVSLKRKLKTLFADFFVYRSSLKASADFFAIKLDPTTDVEFNISNNEDNN